jgi:hypothetical protein
METAADAILANLPTRPMAWLMRLIVPGDPRARRGASDVQLLKAAAAITEPGPARDRLTANVFLPGDGPDNCDDGVARLERAFILVVETEPVRRCLRQAKIRDWREGAAQGVVTAEEARRLEAAEQAVALACAVDDFAPGALEPRREAVNAGSSNRQSPERRAPLPAAPPST